MQNSSVLYAFLDNQFREKVSAKNDSEGLSKDQLRTMSKKDFLALNEKEIELYLRQNGFPRKYNAEKIRKLVRKDEIKPIALVEYVEDANAALFDTPIVGAEVYRSDDGGKTWNRTHIEPLSDVVFTYGYYFGVIAIDPANENKIYVLGVPLLRSDDGGKTFVSISADNVHSDHQAIWVNPTRTGHLINGNDGGVNISYDDGENWTKANSSAVGQFYTVNVDMAEPYNVYGGLQDNGVWMGSSRYQASTGWHPTG